LPEGVYSIAEATLIPRQKKATKQVKDRLARWRVAQQQALGLERIAENLNRTGY